MRDATDPEDRRLPPIDDLKPDVVMLVASDGWDVRALKQARTLSAGGLSVVILGRRRAPSDAWRTQDEFGVDIVRVDPISDAESLRSALSSGVGERLDDDDRSTAETVLDLLARSGARYPAKAVPPPQPVSPDELIGTLRQGRLRADLDLAGGRSKPDLLHAEPAAREHDQASARRMDAKEEDGRVEVAAVSFGAADVEQGPDDGDAHRPTDLASDLILHTYGRRPSIIRPGQRIGVIANCDVFSEGVVEQFFNRFKAQRYGAPVRFATLRATTGPLGRLSLADAVETAALSRRTLEGRFPYLADLWSDFEAARAKLDAALAGIAREGEPGALAEREALALSIAQVLTADIDVAVAPDVLLRRLPISLRKAFYRSLRAIDRPILIWAHPSATFSEPVPQGEVFYGHFGASPLHSSAHPNRNRFRVFAALPVPIPIDQAGLELRPREPRRLSLKTYLDRVWQAVKQAWLVAGVRAGMPLGGGAPRFLLGRVVHAGLIAPVRGFRFGARVYSAVVRRAAQALGVRRAPSDEKRSNVRVDRADINRAYRDARFFLYTLEFGETVARLAPRAIHAHDLYTLQSAVKIAKWIGSKVVYDAHELESDRRAGTPTDVNDKIIEEERRFAPLADRCVTVSHAIADEMQNTLGVERPLVVFNAPIVSGAPSGWSGITVRFVLDLPPTTPIVAFVGKIWAIKDTNQRVELIVRSVARMPGVHLALIGPMSDEAAQDIEDLLRVEADLLDDATAPRRIHFIPTIPAEAIVHFIADADVTTYFMKPDTRNIELTLPNKLFEFTLSGAPIVVSDLHSTRWFCEIARNAILVQDPSEGAISAALREAIERREALRPSAERLAELRREFSWEAQGEKLWAMYRDLLSTPNEGLSRHE